MAVTLNRDDIISALNELVDALAIAYNRTVTTTDIDVLINASGITSFDEAAELYESYYPEDDLKPRARAQLDARFGAS